MRLVKFIKSPIGAFNLAYAEGMTAEINEGQAEILVDAGYAIYLDGIQTSEKTTQTEKRVKK